MTALVTGAAGFIGSHLVNRLVEMGDTVLAVDRKPLDQWYQPSAAATNWVSDLTDERECVALCRGIDEVYALHADMGGIGFIESNRVDCAMSIVPSATMLRGAQRSRVGVYFFASSACIYPGYRQDAPDVPALKESDAYPADCEDGYGWEKLYMERLCRHVYEEVGMETRVARFHNIFGPHGTWEGGREKAPAALCRKIAVASLTGDTTIEVWGDGSQTRSFLFIDECVTGILRITGSQCREPLNLGSDELVTIDELAYMIADIAGVPITLNHNLAAPQGVRGRCSDNTLIKQVLGWAPSAALRAGLVYTYLWVYDQVKAAM